MNDLIVIIAPLLSSSIGVGLYCWGYSRGRKKAEDLHKLYGPGNERLTITLPPQQGMTTKPKTITAKGGRWNA